jgi:hypothetical protein
MQSYNNIQAFYVKWCELASYFYIFKTTKTKNLNNDPCQARSEDF